MSVAKSFFDITTGRSHGVIPTSDAVRVVLDSGATLMLDKVPPCNCKPPDECSDCKGPKVVRARAAWGERGTDPRVGAPNDLLHRAFSCVMPVTGDRIDRALSALVERLLIGDSGVEVTEWTIPSADDWDPPMKIPFGHFTSVPLFVVGEIDLNDGESKEGAITRLLLSAVEMARNDDRWGLIHAVVVRSADDKTAGIACMPDRPEPPVGATLVARRKIGGKPHVDVPWGQIENGRYAIVRRAIDRLKADCAMVGIDIAQSCPELSVLFASKVQHGPGEKSEDILWRTDDDDLMQIIAGMGAKCKRNGRTPTTLRLTAVRRAT